MHDLFFFFKVVTYVVRCLIRSWNIKYSNIHCAANLLAGLVPYHVSPFVTGGCLANVRFLSFLTGKPKVRPKQGVRSVLCVFIICTHQADTYEIVIVL